MNENNRTLEVQLMIYTRSYSFDYTWVYGHKDTKVQRELENLFNIWINNKLLKNLSNKITFFSQINGYFILLIANPSNRTDRVGRMIFDRAMFLWQPNHQLVYEDLNHLARTLDSEAKKVYETLPVDITNIKTEYKKGSIRFESDNNPSSPEETEKFTVVFPAPATWKNIRQQNLIVEVPSNIEFDEIVDLIGDHPIEETLAICHRIPIEDRYPKEKSCIVSASNRSSNEFQVFDHNLHLRFSGHIEKTDISKLRYPSKSANATSEDPTERTNSVSFDEDEIVKTITDEDKFADFLNGLANKISKSGDEESNAVVKQLRAIAGKISLNNKKQLIQPITELLYLLNPAGVIIPIEIHILWQNLFIEILLLQSSSSSDIRKSWSQRISLLKPITFAAISDLKLDAWQSTFDEKCNQLKTLLTDSAVKKDVSFKLNG